MIGKLRTYLKEGFTYYGLEITGAEETLAYVLLELKKSKNQLLIINKVKLNHLNELPGQLNKKNPVFVCINTPNILTKKMERDSNGSPEALVNQAFPNIDLNNIYYEIIQQGTAPIVTLSKRGPIDAILKELHDLKLQVSGFSLGVSALESIVPFLEDGTLHASNYLIGVDDGVLTTISTQASKENLLYTISGLELSSSYLLPFSQILRKLNQKNSISNFTKVNAGLEQGFKNFRIFTQVLKYALLFFIALLLANFLTYNHYHGKVGQLNDLLAATSSQKDELTLLDESVKRKQERVETLSASSNSKATYYLDLFAQRIPSSILLNEIKYQPLAKPVREKKPIMLEEGMLLVSGISKDVDAFSFWIEELEKQEWVNSVETLDYNYVGKTTSNFLIEIGIHANR